MFNLLLSQQKQRAQLKSNLSHTEQRMWKGHFQHFHLDYLTLRTKFAPALLKKEFHY